MSINENTTNLENILDDVNNISIAPVLLWTNASPTSAFLGQTVTLPTGYSAYLVEYRYSTSDASCGKTFLPFSTAKQGSGASVGNNGTSVMFAGREVSSVSDGSISFGNGHIAYSYINSSGGNGGRNTKNGIPTRIWGVKFTL